MYLSAGTGGNPELGEQAAQESYADLAEVVGGADMVRFQAHAAVSHAACTGTRGTRSMHAHISGFWMGPTALIPTVMVLGIDTCRCQRLR